MAYIPRSSFGGQIPNPTPVHIQQKHTIRLFATLSTIVLVIVFLAFIGLFAYTHYLNKQLGVAQTELNALNDSGTERKMLEVQMYNRKLNIARFLLDNHVATSRIFSMLEDTTKQTIRFSSLKYKYDPGFEAELTLGGDTKELKSVALQKMQIINDNVFSNFIVRGINTSAVLATTDGKPKAPGTNIKSNENGASLGVGFEVVGVFDKDLLKYEADAGTSQINGLPQENSLQGEGTHGSDVDATSTVSTSSNQVRL